MTNKNDVENWDEAAGNEADGSERDGSERDGSEADGGETTGNGDDTPTSAGPGIDPEEMSLEELRQEIRGIDREIVELIARRTYVADTIAQVKAQEDLPTVDEEQESRVMERAGHNAEQFDVDANLVKAIFRLLIELNKVEQRERR